MGAMRFKVGQQARIHVTTQVNDANTDPSDLALTITKPDGTEEEFIYGDEPTFENDGTGLFHLDYLLQSRGLYVIRGVASGTFNGADEEELVVR